MAKENTNGTQATQQSTTPNYDAWKAGILKKYPDVNPDDQEALFAASMAGYDTEHDYAKEQRASVGRFQENLNKHPELASFYNSIINSEDEDLGEAILNLGDLISDYATGKIDSEAYKKGLETRKQFEAEYDTKRQAQDIAFKQACDELGVDPNETSKMLQDKIINPMAAIELTVDVWKTLINAINRDEDVAAAEARGRNTSIAAQRGKVEHATDGMQHAGSAAAPASKETKSSIDQIGERRSAFKKL